MTLAVGVDHQIITENAYTEHISADEDTGKMVYRVAALARADDHDRQDRHLPHVARRARRAS